MMLNSVVLPAPFGPMRAVTDPRSTSRDAPSTARTPPNRRETPPTARMASPPLPAARPSARSAATSSVVPALPSCALRSCALPSCVAKRHLHATADQPLRPERGHQDEGDADGQVAQRGDLVVGQRQPDEAGAFEQDPQQRRAERHPAEARPPPD